MSDFTKALIEMLRHDPHVKAAFGYPAPIFEDAPKNTSDPYVICAVKADDSGFDISLTVWTWGEAKADILIRLNALATAIRTGRIEGFDTSTRRIRLMDIFLDDSCKTRNGLLRARINISTDKCKEKQHHE